MSNQGKSAAAPAAATKQDGKKETVKREKVAGIKVVSQTDGFRRGGRTWTVAPTVVAVSEFSDEQLEQIRAEPKLLVSDVADIGKTDATDVAEDQD